MPSSRPRAVLGTSKSTPPKPSCEHHHPHHFAEPLQSDFRLSLSTQHRLYCRTIFDLVVYYHHFAAAKRASSSLLPLSSTVCQSLYHFAHCLYCRITNEIDFKCVQYLLHADRVAFTLLGDPSSIMTALPARRSCYRHITCATDDPCTANPRASTVLCGSVSVVKHRGSVCIPSCGDCTLFDYNLSIYNLFVFRQWSRAKKTVF